MTSKEIRDAIDSMSADELEAHGLMRGPVDADGIAWHSGDMSDTNWGVIDDIAYHDGTWYICGHDTSAPWMEADKVRHRHKPTIEDVLYKCCNEYHDAMLMGICDIPCDVPSLSEIITKHAAMLREMMADE